MALPFKGVISTWYGFCYQWSSWDREIEVCWLAIWVTSINVRYFYTSLCVGTIVFYHLMQNMSLFFRLSMCLACFMSSCTCSCLIVLTSTVLTISHNHDLPSVSHLVLLTTRGNSFCKTSLQVGMDLSKVQKQGRDERTQEDYPTFVKIHSKCRVVFLHSFIPALFLYFFQIHPYLK